MKPIFFIIILFLSTSAYGVAIHYDKYQTDLTTTKHTTPSLNTIYNGVHYYGALFTNPPPKNTLHFLSNDTTYWLGPWCDAGTYATGGNQCTQCGIGHYCPGGIERNSCTYGIIGCPNTNHQSDSEMPTGTENIYNRILTMSEVETYLPPTTLDDWEKIYLGLRYDSTKPCDMSPNDPHASEINFILTPGTYLVLHRRYGDATSVSSDAICGIPYVAATAYIIIFDHNVSYRPIGACNQIFNYFDTNNTPFKEYTLRIPDRFHITNENITNINNLCYDLTQMIGNLYATRLGVFKLK